MNSLIHDWNQLEDQVATFNRAFRMDALEWQKGYLPNERNAIVLKGRQVGASTAASIKAIHLAHYHPGSLAVIVSPSMKQSQEIAIRAKAGIRNLERLPLQQDSATMIRLANGSRIMSLPGTATSVRGYTAQLLIVDEAAYVEEETWVASRALVATGGQVIVQSTPAGAAGWFYELWRSNDPTWDRHQIRSDEVPTISKEFLAQEKISMGEYAYKAEYCAEFLEAGAGLFDAEVLQGMVDAGAQAYDLGETP
jgi:hypothetical protein